MRHSHFHWTASVQSQGQKDDRHGCTSDRNGKTNGVATGLSICIFYSIGSDVRAPKTSTDRLVTGSVTSLSMLDRKRRRPSHRKWIHRRKRPNNKSVELTGGGANWFSGGGQDGHPAGRSVAAAADGLAAAAVMYVTINHNYSVVVADRRPMCIRSHTTTRHNRDGNSKRPPC